MAYKINVTEHADELLDHLVYHLIYRLKNKQAAEHLLDFIDVIYDRLENNSFQFAECKDTYLAKKGYREAVVPQMNYIIIFDVSDNVVNIVGIFHQLENYQKKL
ncbi:MAG: type II toxin-antitoxin system RelE/ParE family toxin [Lachnospiraceae bacterium]|nr:type II toxin-antitoxin system RelE/ParE family toxin [Lachnospiraceae bacterium]